MTSHRTTAQWRALFVALREPGDQVVVAGSRRWIKIMLRRCAPERVRYVHLEPVKDGTRLVRLAEPKNLTRRMVELAVGDELTLAHRHRSTLARLAVRVRQAHPERRYRTHHDRRLGTCSVMREA